MPKSEITAAVDIGSGQIVCAVGRRAAHSDHVEIVMASRQLCRGVKGGVVINIDETALAITRAIEEAEEATKETINELVVGIRGPHIQTFNNRGAVNIARSDKEISTDDVAQVIESTKAIQISTDRDILHVIPQDFVLDRQHGVPNPVGMEGSLLEVDVHMVTAGRSHLNNIYRTINNAGFSVREAVYGLLALGDAVVTPEEKELGCLLIDLGGATTSLAVYVDGGLRFTKELSIGADAITNDLAYGLRTSFSQAKIVKERYGSAVRANRKQVLVAMEASEENGSATDEDIYYTSVDGRTKKQIQRNALYDFVAPRVEEIFSLVRAEVDNSGLAEQIVPGGVIVTGGGSMMPGMIVAAEKILELPARHGLPQNITGVPDYISHPSYATAAGLLLFNSLSQHIGSSGRPQRRSGGSLLGQVKSFFADLF